MAAKKASLAIIPVDRVQQRILIIRGQRVILASDLARLYGVPVKRLNEQVRRNADRFPEDFVFQLSKAEADGISRSQIAALNRPEILKSQIATSSWGGARRALPYAFTEHGAKLSEHDERFTLVFDAIRELMEEGDDDDPPKPPIGFHTELGLRQPPKARKK